jgi:Acetyltransferase (GNAT) domain
MPPAFRAVRAPSADHLARLGQITGSNPFHTPSYAAVRVAMGQIPWLFTLWTGEDMVGGCLGFQRGLWPVRRLEIVTAPNGPDADIVWSGVQSFCRVRRVAELTINTWAGFPGTVPTLPGERRRRERTEYVLDLREAPRQADLSVNHRRNINRAQRAGLVSHRTTRLEAARALANLQRFSLERRNRRGEAVPHSHRRAVRFLELLVAHKAGEISQVMDGRDILSAALFLRSGPQAYYHSSGTSPEGMERGASALLIWEAAGALRAEGVNVLNLGGADSDGLRRFKRGFGAREVHLEAASFAPHRSAALVLSAAQRIRMSVRG